MCGKNEACFHFVLPVIAKQAFLLVGLAGLKQVAAILLFLSLLSPCPYCHFQQTDHFPSLNLHNISRDR